MPSKEGVNGEPPHLSLLGLLFKLKNCSELKAATVARNRRTDHVHQFVYDRRVVDALVGQRDLLSSADSSEVGVAPEELALFWLSLSRSRALTRPASRSQCSPGPAASSARIGCTSSPGSQRSPERSLHADSPLNDVTMRCLDMVR